MCQGSSGCVQRCAPHDHLFACTRYKQRLKTRLAIGAPVVREEFVYKAQRAGHMVVHSVDTSYSVISGTVWNRLGDGTATK